MSLEAATYINTLDASNPTATDPKSQGDDHIRLVKSVLKATFPNVSGAVTATQTEINLLAGQTGAISFPAGTRMPFAQAAAPTGWTQDTSDTADDRMLRVVKTSGGGTGGVKTPILMDVVPAHTHGFTTGGNSVDHTHADAGHAHGTGQFPTNIAGSTIFLTTGSANSQLASGTGVGNANLGGQTVGHTHSGATDAGSSQTNWQPRYLSLIICAKN